MHGNEAYEASLREICPHKTKGTLEGASAAAAQAVTAAVAKRYPWWWQHRKCMHLCCAASLLQVSKQHLRAQQPPRDLHPTMNHGVAHARPVCTVTVGGCLAAIRGGKQRNLQVMLLATCSAPLGLDV